MIHRLLAALLLALVLGFGFASPAFAHGPAGVAPADTVSVAPGSLDGGAAVAAPEAVVTASPAELAPPAAAAPCHCDWGICSAAAPQGPVAAGAGFAREQRDGPGPADQVVALNVVDPPLQPPER